MPMAKAIGMRFGDEQAVMPLARSVLLPRTFEAGLATMLRLVMVLLLLLVTTTARVRGSAWPRHDPHSHSHRHSH